MPDHSDNSPGRFTAPGPQKNLDRATELAFEALAQQTDDQLLWLKAERSGGGWRLPVLDEAFEVDLCGRRVRTSAGREVGPHWRILALHYLAISARPETRIPEVTFADLPDARSYASIYQGRVNARLCATVGQKAETLTAAARALGGRIIEGGDAAFDFRVFPRLSLRLIWHAGDDEFPPSATVLLPSNVGSYFCAEDVVVLSERLVSRLGGRPF